MATTPSAARHLVFDIDVYGVIGGMDTYPRLWLGFPHIGWLHFRSAVDRCHGLRSVALAELDRCDGRLDAEAEGDREPRGYYRAVPDAAAMARREGGAEELGAELSGAEGPDGTPWKVRVSSAGLCGAGGEEYDQRLLECSQVVLQRMTGLSGFLGG